MTISFDSDQWMRFLELKFYIDSYPVILNIPLYILTLVACIPAYTLVEYERLNSHNYRTFRSTWSQIAMGSFISIILSPCLITGLSWATLPDRDSYRSGVILSGLGRNVAIVCAYLLSVGANMNIAAFLIFLNALFQLILYPFYIFLFDGTFRNLGFTQGTYFTPKEYLEIFYASGIYLIFYYLIPVVLGIFFRYFGFLVLGKMAMKTSNLYRKLARYISILGLVSFFLLLTVLQAQNIVDNYTMVIRILVPRAMFSILSFTGYLYLLNKLLIDYETSMSQVILAATSNYQIALFSFNAISGLVQMDELIQKQVQDSIYAGYVVELIVITVLLRLGVWTKHNWNWGAPSKNVPVQLITFDKESMAEFTGRDISDLGIAYGTTSIISQDGDSIVGSKTQRVPLDSRKQSIALNETKNGVSSPLTDWYYESGSSESIASEDEVFESKSDACHLNDELYTISI